MATSADIPANLSSFDRLVQAWQARFTGGLSPASLWLSYFDWLAHLSNTPGNQARLFEQSCRDGMRLAEYTARSADPQTPACVEPRPQDQRFAGEDWLRWPFNLIAMSHVFVLDVPTYPRPLFITDAALNVYLDLEEKWDIVQNAIDLAHVLGIETPRVAILSAVETVSPKIHSTLEAAALCKMADRGQITGGIVDGPLAFDNAVSSEAARTKGIISPVAGQADILFVPDLEAGNMLAKQLEYLADAELAGIVLGARVPIILTSRADSQEAQTASCALALLVAQSKRKVQR